MVSISKRKAAEKVIDEMKVGKWETLESLARKARTGAYTLLKSEMAGFLKIARELGKTERRGAFVWKFGRRFYVSEWRRIE